MRNIFISSIGDKLQNESVGVTASIERTFNKLSLYQVRVEESAEVRKYLVHYPDLVDVLPELCATIRERFGKDAQISLEFYRGPVPDEGYLVIYVRQRHYEETILDVIDEIHAKLKNALDDQEGWLIITTDFQPPR